MKLSLEHVAELERVQRGELHTWSSTRERLCKELSELGFIEYVYFAGTFGMPALTAAGRTELMKRKE